MSIELFPADTVNASMAAIIDRAVRTATYNGAYVAELHDYGESLSALVATVGSEAKPNMVAHTLQHTNLLRELKIGKECLFRIGERKRIPVRIKI